MISPRLVLDTNVLLSALLFRQGPVAWRRMARQSNAIRPLTSRETAEELIRVLYHPKFKLTDADREDLLADYLPWCETFTVPEKIQVPTCRDPLDRPFLVLAAAARADALITGDKDLLSLAESFKIPILTPAEFKERFENDA